MITTIKNIFSIVELRSKLLYTLFILFVYRLASHVPTPGIDTVKLKAFFDQAENASGFLGLLDVFAGGAMSRATILALGVMPYISASIILQLMTAVVPSLQKLAKEGDLGRKKLNQYTRYLTVFITMFQAIGFAKLLDSYQLVTNYNTMFIITTMLAMTAGTMLVMWFGELITAKGLGNGISIIIFAGIVARIPASVMQFGSDIQNGQMDIAKLIVLLAVMVAIVYFVVLIQEGQRKIPVQYPKRIVGRKMTVGQTTYLPLKINQAGVIPVIFASSILMFPQQMQQFLDPTGKVGFLKVLGSMFSYASPTYILTYLLLIVFFTYFYTAITLNPIDVADNLKKSGGFIPGVRPGQATADHVNFILNRIALPGALFLGFIAILPIVMSKAMFGSSNSNLYFGGTSLLIAVGVGLDFMKQIESHLLMSHYDGFTKKGRLGKPRRY